MNYVQHSPWRKWTVLWQVLFASLFAVVIFIGLNVLSAGIFLSMLTVSLAFAAFALAHYWIWGREMTHEVAGLPRPATETRPLGAVQSPPVVDIAIELSEPQRVELMQVLEQSLPQVQGRQAALRREVLDKLRMYGA